MFAGRTLFGPKRRWNCILQRIKSLAAETKPVDDHDLRKRSLALRYRAKCGEPTDRLLPEAFALVAEAGFRRLGMRHYDVQFLGGIAMQQGAVAEMQTGEGKTLTATLPLYLNALVGKGVHLATVNDYLARRDAEWMTPLYEALGMTVGVVQTQMPQPERLEAYACDVTYGTAREFGFDFLRDRLLLRRKQHEQDDWTARLATPAGDSTDQGEQPVQQRSYFALIDEADSVLIDEARIPLIISAAEGDDPRAAKACYHWSAEIVPRLVEEGHFEYDHKNKQPELTTEGRQFVRAASKTPGMDTVALTHIYEYVERAIVAARDFIRDRHYVIQEGEIVIIDEFTGRPAEGRKWRRGLHQAIEAKEGLDPTLATAQAAQITVQELFSQYERLAGMTGTASSSVGELRKVYGLRVATIPTNRPSHRDQLPDRVFSGADEKWTAIVEEIRQVHAANRPVLVGTRSIDKSEHLSDLLKAAGIDHQVLNAQRLAEEAEIVAQAGDAGKVTVATNMAGRGTDIVLGEGVAEIGGLHVICTEMHDSSRIDRQLVGRCGRQGDPGSFRQFLALDDDILKAGLGPDRSERMEKTGTQPGKSLDHLIRLFRVAQKKVERKHVRDRRMLMHFVRQRTKTQQALGQDPYLDTPG